MVKISYISREIYTRQGYCTVLTNFCCIMMSLCR